MRKSLVPILVSGITLALLFAIQAASAAGTYSSNQSGYIATTSTSNPFT